MFTVIGIFGFIGGLALVVWAILQGSNKYQNRDYNEKTNYSKEISIAGLGAVVILVTALIVSSVTSVPPGHRGVVLRWGGEVEKRVMTEGLNFKIPLVETVIMVDVRIQAHEFVS